MRTRNVRIRWSKHKTDFNSLTLEFFRRFLLTSTFTNNNSWGDLFCFGTFNKHFHHDLCTRFTVGHDKKKQSSKWHNTRRFMSDKTGYRLRLSRVTREAYCTAWLQAMTSRNLDLKSSLSWSGTWTGLPGSGGNRPAGRDGILDGNRDSAVLRGPADLHHCRTFGVFLRWWKFEHWRS